jgi:hypothetical protein
MVGIHVVIRALSDAENMWRNFKSVLSPISLKDIFSIDAEVCGINLRTGQREGH